ncbi:hypothetical protein GCM10027265_11260 [Jatrophihabitans fulvus]
MKPVARTATVCPSRRCREGSTTTFCSRTPADAVGDTGSADGTDELAGGGLGVVADEDPLAVPDDPPPSLPQAAAIVTAATAARSRPRAAGPGMSWDGKEFTVVSLTPGGRGHPVRKARRGGAVRLVVGHAERPWGRRRRATRVGGVRAER